MAVVRKSTKKATKKSTKKATKAPLKRVSSSKSVTKTRTTKSRTTKKARKLYRIPAPSFIEKLLGAAMKRECISFIAQFKVKRKRFGNYYLDFGIPEFMLAIEADGAAYHSTPAQLAKDAKRQKELEDLNWTVIRFTGSQICKDINSCLKVIKAHLRMT